MLIPNKREFLARRLGELGVVRLLERASRRPSLLVVTHHRIGDPASNPYYDLVYSASPEALRAQLLTLRDRFRVRSLETLDLNEPITEPTALITFDDGYRDNFDTAFPILAELGLPAAFFIPTRFFEEPRLPWWDHAAYVIKRSPNSRLVLDRPMPLAIDLGPPPRAEAVHAIIRLYLDGLVADEADFRAHLEERAGVALDESARGRKLFMSWDQVRRLAEAGMTIGSHAHSHRKLAALSEDEQRAELAESKQILENRLGRDVRTLAYPFGWTGTFDDRSKQLARESGYRLAFSSKEGVNRPADWDPLALRRLNVGFRDSPHLLRARTALYATFGKSPL